MSFILCTSGAAISRAGLNYNTGVSGALLNQYSDDAENEICAETRRDWIALSGSTLANFKGTLSLAAASHIANSIINYDMSGYTSRTEAQTMLDVNLDNYKRAIETLKDQKNQEKMVS